VHARRDILARVIELIVKVIASYLLGSLIGSLIVGRLRGGVDIRTLGSGNAGGTNALRTQGRSFALWVMVIDIGKGIVATRLIAAMALPALGFDGNKVYFGPVADGPWLWLTAACGFAVIVGHIYPLWYGFRGGKGVATLIGVLFGIDPMLLLVVLLVWLVTVAVFGFVGLASIVSAAVVPVFFTVANFGMDRQAPMLVFGVAVAVLVAYTHRANIARMRAGTEPRSKRLWLLGRGRTP
jgi:acyl phosphate:glycerol-3-phosphate acyltransferase